MSLYELNMRQILTLYTHMVGWTLQELLAPSYVEFYDQDWTFRGSRKDHIDTISKFTSIPTKVLLRPKTIYMESVGARMSWASMRITKRTEDMAYCLLGLFEINMPLIYGEGKRAFLRLQEEIIKRNNDLTILGWDNVLRLQSCHGLVGVLATSPKAFAGSADLQNIYVGLGPEFSVTNRGLLLTGNLKFFYRSSPERPGKSAYVLQIATSSDSMTREIGLRKLAPGLYGRLRKLPRLESYNASVKSYFDHITDTPIDENSIYIRTDFHQTDISTHLTTSRKNALHVLKQEDLEILQVTPQWLWDYSDAVFLQTRQDNLIYPHYSSVVAVEFRLWLGGHNHSIFVVYESGVITPVLHVSSYHSTLERHQGITRLFPTPRGKTEIHRGNEYRDLVSKKDISWEDVKREAPWLLTQGDSINVRGTDNIYNIRFFLEPGKLNLYNIPVISLKASVVKGEPLWSWDERINLLLDLAMAI